MIDGEHEDQHSFSREGWEALLSQGGDFRELSLGIESETDFEAFI